MLRAAIRGNGYQNLKKAVQLRKSFNTSGALRGRSRSEDWPSTMGYLKGEDRKKYLEDMTQMTFVAYSYDTPIMWVLTDGTVYHVSQKFSVTTSRHQGIMQRLTK